MPGWRSWLIAVGSKSLRRPGQCPQGLASLKVCSSGPLFWSVLSWWVLLFCHTAPAVWSFLGFASVLRAGKVLGWTKDWRLWQGSSASQLFRASRFGERWVFVKWIYAWPTQSLGLTSESFRFAAQIYSKHSDTRGIWPESFLVRVPWLTGDPISPPSPICKSPQWPRPFCCWATHTVWDPKSQERILTRFLFKGFCNQFEPDSRKSKGFAKNTSRLLWWKPGFNRLH